MTNVQHHWKFSTTRVNQPTMVNNVNNGKLTNNSHLKITQVLENWRGCQGEIKILRKLITVVGWCQNAKKILTFPHENACWVAQIFCCLETRLHKKWIIMIIYDYHDCIIINANILLVTFFATSFTTVFLGLTWNNAILEFSQWAFKPDRVCIWRRINDNGNRQL